MKKKFLICTVFLSIIFLGNLSFAQDMIILKTGDEIKSKVLEITPDLVKYKKWENQEGPAYSSNKSDIFMIKYANGTKEVFTTVPAVNSNNSQSSSGSIGNKFLGIWYYKKYNGMGNRTIINISKAIDNYLVEFKVYEDVGNNLYASGGSFKEIGNLQNGSIVVNSNTKLSLLNENTLLLNSWEFYRTPKNSQSQGLNSSSSATTNGSAGLNPIFTIGTIDTIEYHNDQNYISIIVFVTKSLKETLRCTGEGTKIYGEHDDQLSFINLYKGMKISFDGDLTESSGGIRCYKPTRINTY